MTTLKYLAEQYAYAEGALESELQFRKEKQGAVDENWMDNEVYKAEVKRNETKEALLNYVRNSEIL